MAYLKTILTYHLPYEAELDRSLLESHGITVNLLNANTTRNELGAPFHIQLQVPDEEVEAAVGVIREFNPARFGSPERVARIERELGRNLAWLLGASVLAGLATYGLLPDGYPGDRLTDALLGGVIAGPLLCVGFRVFKRKS